VQTYVSYFRRWHAENAGRQTEAPKPAPAPTPQPPVAVVPREEQPPRKAHGQNDAHILAQIEKRFRKLRKLQDRTLYAPHFVCVRVRARVCVCGS
jgi:hypothetical protein